MKKSKKIVLIVILSFVFLFVVGIYVYKTNKYTLTISERKWIDNNLSSILNINVVNDSNIYGSNGEGIFFDFLEDFTSNYDLKINPITVKHTDKTNILSFNSTIKPNKKDLIFGEDHYVLVSNRNHDVYDYKDLFGSKISIRQEDLSYVSKYIDGNNIMFEQYKDEEDLISSLDTNKYLIVPRYLFLDTILKDDLKIVYNLSDIKYYYTLNNDDSTLFKIISKYYFKTWQKNLYESYNKNKFDVFMKSLNITDGEVEALRGGVFKYGFLENQPYDIYKSSNYGGINAVVLKEFSDFSKIDIDFIYYKKESNYKKDLTNKELSMYFDNINYKTDYIKSEKGFPLEYYIVLPKTNTDTINSVTYLENKTIYVNENSKLKNSFSNISGVKLKTYKTQKDLKKISKNKEIIVLDKNEYNSCNKNLKNYVIKFNGLSSDKLNYRFNKKSGFSTLFDKYLNSLDLKEYANKGVNNYEEVYKKGELFNVLARGTLVLIFFLLIVAAAFVKKARKINIAKKIKKEDKLKFVDQLTSLKNRNYLTEHIDVWNNNIIYPQSVITIDLNGIKDINDKYGYEEGDKQIASFANILIKRQLDDSEIMRTDGNEFTIYLVGYDKTKTVNYIRKLNRHVKKLPYDLGAKFGYSMIEDELKTIEDALNEALIDMRKEK